MLSALILENFKAFGRRQVIPLAPITLIFGANSSGKSTILQSLLLLKQTLAEEDTGDRLLVPQGDLVKLGNSDEMLFRRDHRNASEITPLVSTDRVGKESLSRALSLLGLRPPESFGIGVSFGFDPSAKSFVLDGVPCYCGNTEMPAFRLEPVQAALDHELGTDAARNGCLARIGGLNANHPFWQACYADFIEPLNVADLSTLLRFVGIPVESEAAGSLKPLTLSNARDSIRALQGWPKELVQEAAGWARVYLEDQPPEVLDTALRALQDGTDLPVEFAKDYICAVLNKLLGACFAENPEEVLEYVWESPAVDQMRRLVEALVVLDAIELGGDELQDELNDLEAFSVRESDLTANTNWERVRALMERRLLALADYSIDRFIRDVQERNALQTLGMQGFLPSHLPFPGLVDGHLRTLLQALFKGDRP